MKAEFGHSILMFGHQYIVIQGSGVTAQMPLIDEDYIIELFIRETHTRKFNDDAVWGCQGVLADDMRML